MPDQVGNYNAMDPDRVAHDESGAFTQTLKVIIFPPQRALFRQKFGKGVYAAVGFRARKLCGGGIDRGGVIFYYFISW